MPLEVGTKAPDFTLSTKTADGPKQIKLSGNFGKKHTLLLFFPMAFTGTCTEEICSVGNGLREYEHKVAKDYGVVYDSFLPQINLGMGGVPKRSAFIIDKNGVIQHAESNDDPKQLPDFDKIKAKLADLK